jgi:UDP-N-acetylglucosamine 2-epimerase (non-hydrolysing)
VKILVVFGTRPEAIKLAPVIQQLRRRPELDVSVVTTAQHRELLDQVLNVFRIVPDADLAVMRPRQTLAELSGRVLVSLDRTLADRSADLLIVQGDTTSAFMCGLAAFYRGIPVAHVEAGLRTSSPVNPFPEEMNRRLTTALSSLHFAPTTRARDCLLSEGVAHDRVFVTGNTVVDALMQIRESEPFQAARARVNREPGERLLLVTLHRRESWGAPLAGMCRALRAVAQARSDVRFVMPVHLNPAVRQVVHEWLGGVPRISLIEPLDYLDFIALMEASWLVLTDSGGVQEEAPTLGRPVLVLRDTTERPEAVDHGVARLVGTSPDAILTTTLDLLDHPAQRDRMARTVNPFGDGHAATRIAEILVSRAASTMSAKAEVRPAGGPERC